MKISYICLVLLLLGGWPKISSSYELESYLDWPRIHFSGHFVADVSTLNNIRCNFYNPKFTPSNLMQGYPRLALDPKTGVYSEPTSSWNPDGTAQFYFINAKVTSLCEKGKPCSTEDPIVGLEVSGSHAVYVDLDVDWQLISSVIYGLELNIDGILRGKFAESEVMIPRVQGGDHPSGIHKSFLTDVVWASESYKEMFGSADKLSISLTLDMYSKPKRSGRFTATIGPTSVMDPLSVPAYRVLTPSNIQMWSSLSIASFQYLEEESAIVLDLSLSIPADADGHFDSEKLGELDLVLVKSSESCGDDDDYGEETRTVARLTSGGAISKLIGNNDAWFKTFGGVVQVDISGADKILQHMIPYERLALTQTLNGSMVQNVMVEVPHGIRVGLMERTTSRLNVDEEILTWTVFASSFGKPLDGYEVSIQIQENAKADDDCGWGGDICHMDLATPDALQISPLTAKTDENGLAIFTLRARSNPGNPRGCGLDGQVYPLMINLTYVSKLGESLTFVDGSLSASVPPPKVDFSLSVSSPAIVIFSHTTIPENLSWQDVKEIFQLYHNLYPVMWRRGIVNMGTYEGVTQSSFAIQYFMNISESDSRYMPITRDLSKSKKKMIFEWFEKGSEQFPQGNIVPTCNELVEGAKENREKLWRLLHRAITLELTTIPPYFTAWLSLKTENGKNLEIAQILSSIYVQEMFHFALASNILNAVGGEMQLNVLRSIPVFPSALGFGSFYDISPQMMATIEPMSIGQASDIFSAIEYPEIGPQQEEFEKIACIARLVANETSLTDDGSSIEIADIFSVNFKEFISEFSSDNDCHWDPNLSDREKWGKIRDMATAALSKLATTDISTIGSFYAEVALRTSLLESCFQLQPKPSSVFEGKADKQVEFPPEVIKVENLLSAINAIVEIVYQGEGGSKCSPYVDSKSTELSHFYRFQEIVYGRKLIKVHPEAEIYTDVCLNISKSCGIQALGDFKFCYLGDKIPLYKDGIWPIASSPQPQDYIKGSKADILNTRFNTVYSNLLRCLQDTFSGNPDHLMSCISEMHDLAIEGKKLVNTQVEEGKHAGKNVAPTWSYVRNPTERAGLPVLTLP